MRQEEVHPVAPELPFAVTATPFGRAVKQGGIEGYLMIFSPAFDASTHRIGSQFSHPRANLRLRPRPRRLRWRRRRDPVGDDVEDAHQHHSAHFRLRPIFGFPRYVLPLVARVKPVRVVSFGASVLPTRWSNSCRETSAGRIRDEKTRRTLSKIHDALPTAVVRPRLPRCRTSQSSARSGPRSELARTPLVSTTL